MFKSSFSLRGSVRTLALLAAASALPSAASAQQFTVFGKDVQVHGFASQGFLASNQNNFLTMKTSDGSGVFSDAGFNIASSPTKKLRVGAQGYLRNIGNLGQGDMTIDWAQGDYRFASWLGVRAGKVKTVMGLYNDTQDMEFLHTFAMLPQSVYPLDMRDGTIAHLGADVYGSVRAGASGTVSYVGYVGRRKDTKNGGYPYLLRGAGIDFDEYGGPQYGADVRWQLPAGVLVGLAHMRGDITGTGTFTGSFDPTMPPVTTPYEEHSNQDHTTQYYGQYQHGALRIDAEHRRYYRDQQIFNGGLNVMTDVRSWYTAGAYRLTDWVELGGYYSVFNIDAETPGFAPPTSNFVHDKVVAARFDVNRMINIKVETHLMDGYGNPGMYPNGFYTVDNPNGLQQKTNLFVVRTGFNF